MTITEIKTALAARKRVYWRVDYIRITGVYGDIVHTFNEKTNYRDTVSGVLLDFCFIRGR